ncbi:MAG: hypothetical protein ACJ762_09750 [Solirubrobacteraceae bacterium]
MVLILLFPALAAAAVVPLLFGTWFDPSDTFRALHGEKPGVVLEPSAWDASSTSALAIVVLVVVVLVSVLLAARGRFAAWTVAAATAILGGLVCLMLRHSPPDPGHATFVTGEQAYDATDLGIYAMACFVFAALDITAWAMVMRRRV